MTDANFTPTLGEYKSLQPFRFWCQKVLPLVYDDSLSYYELLCKVVDYLNKTMEDVETLHGDITNLHKAYVELQTYVNNYFNNLDVQNEINNKLDAMASDGTLLTIISPTISTETAKWLSQHITNPANPPIDTSLTVSGAAADAKTVGTKIEKINKDLYGLESGGITPDMTDFLTNGRQLFNYKRATIHLYYNSVGDVTENTALSGYYIKVKPGSKIDVNGGNIYGASFTFDMKWLESYVDQADGSTITLPENAEWLYISIATSQIENIVISYTENTAFWLRDYSAVGTNLEGATPYSIYEYTYIKKQKACCNQGGNNECAYYAGVDCKTSINIISCSWVWEKGTNSGTLALIINPNGIKKISDITNLSLHLQVRNNYLALDILGQRFDKYYYQELIHQVIPSMALDGKTEHTVTLIANTTNNVCSVIIDGTTYNKEFVPDSNITSINDVLGPYATFEHFSAFNRESAGMPQITSFIVRKDDDYIVYDNFKRQDGQLQNTPQGNPYYLLSTLHNRG